MFWNTQHFSSSTVMYSDDRTPATFIPKLHDVIETQSTLTASRKPKLLIIDEIDGVLGNEGKVLVQKSILMGTSTSSKIIENNRFVLFPYIGMYRCPCQNDWQQHWLWKFLQQNKKEGYFSNCVKFLLHNISTLIFLTIKHFINRIVFNGQLFVFVMTCMYLLWNHFVNVP
jgi:hypothetical protein